MEEVVVLALFTYREAVEEFGSRSAVNKAVGDGIIYSLQRNVYSTERVADPFAVAMKLYPKSIVTGLSAFYIHGLADKVPLQLDLATKRSATRIANDEIKQHFVANSLFEVGLTIVDYDGTPVRVYDLETMLYYLLHHENKLPFDLFKEVMKSYRSQASKVDYKKLQSYADILPGGRKNLERIIREIL